MVLENHFLEDKIQKDSFGGRGKKWAGALEAGKVWANSLFWFREEDTTMNNTPLLNSV